MKRLALLAMLAAPAAAQLPLPYTVAVAPDVSVRVWVPSGSVRVETWDRDSIRVTGTVDRGVHFFGGGAGHGAKLGVENDDIRSTAIPSGDLTVTVPRKAHVWVKMTDGAVHASGTTGELEVVTVTGTIDVSDASGVVAIETIDAVTNLTRISGDVRARSGGGRVTLSQVAGILTATTISGSVELIGNALPDARIETIGGGISLHGNVAPESSIELETHSGPIALVLDRIPPSLDLSSRTGTVKNQAGKSKLTSGRISAHSFKGDISAQAKP